jgi:hypothetical protein
LQGISFHFSPAIPFTAQVAELFTRSLESFIGEVSRQMRWNYECNFDLFSKQLADCAKLLNHITSYHFNSNSIYLQKADFALNQAIKILKGRCKCIENLRVGISEFSDLIGRTPNDQLRRIEKSIRGNFQTFTNDATRIALSHSTSIDCQMELSSVKSILNSVMENFDKRMGVREPKDEKMAASFSSSSSTTSSSLSSSSTTSSSLSSSLSSSSCSSRLDIEGETQL